MLSEINRLKYFLIFQIVLLILSAYLDFLPFYFFLIVSVLSFIAYKSFTKPWLVILLMMGVILIDAIIPYEFKASNPSFMLSEVLFLFLFIVILLRLVFDFEIEVEIPHLIMIWIPFLFWALVVGLMVGADKIRIISYWKNYLLGFFIFSVAIIYIRNSNQVEKLILSLILWGVILAILELKVIFETGGVISGIIGIYLQKNLLSVSWGKSNYLAAFFVNIIPLTIGYLIYIKKLWFKVLLVFALLIMFVGITLTLSRGGILALLLAISLLLTRILNRKYFFGFTTIIGLISLIILINPLTYVIIDRISSLDKSNSVFSRINFYKDVWNAFLDNPLTGVGLGNLGYYSKFILGPELSPSAHNIILGALGELGIIGGFFYLFIFIYLGKKILVLYKVEDNDRLKSLRWCLFASFIGGMLHSLVEPTLEGFQFAIIFWSVIALNFKVDRLKNQPINSIK